MADRASHSERPSEGRFPRIATPGRSFSPVPLLLGWLALLLLAGCETAPVSPGPETETPAEASDLEVSLVELASAALARGELDAAERRFERALRANPGSTEARVGLARIALARGRLGEARQFCEEAIAREPEAADALVVLAEVARRSEDPEGARALLERAVRAGPGNPEAHSARAALTGLAPRVPRPTGEEALRLAERHPYDPWARLQAARQLLSDGQGETAARILREGLWFADLDPPSALAGLKLLRTLDDAWAKRRIVAVHCYADQTLRADPTWQMRLRMLWAGLSTAMEPVLDTAFLPLSMSPFSSEAATADLASIDAALLATVPSPPHQGILAAFTERPPPRRRGTFRLGQAEYLGRHMLVRLDPGAVESRTLIHEVLHLYGAIHITDEVDSLMNPSGDSLALDQVNRDIAALLRSRRFGLGGFRTNIFPFVDQEKLTALLLQSLRLNLHFRRLGVLEATEARESSRFVAASIAREAAEMDPDLAGVARFVGLLLFEQKRFAEAAQMLDLAAKLYGPRSREGRAMSRKAEQLRRSMAPGGVVTP